MKPRVWFYSELYWPEETSTGYFVTRIAEDVSRDAPVFAVCSQPTYSARGRVAPRRETKGGVEIRRLPSTTWNKDRLLFRIMNMMTFSVAVFIHALTHLSSDDTVVAVTNPPLLPYLVRIACRLRRARFVLLVHDVYPDVLVATGMVRRDSLPARLMSAASRRLYRSAHRTIVLGRDMERLVADRIGKSGPAPVIIPNWGDVLEIRPDCSARDELRSQLGLEGRFVVQYLGNMGRTHDLESLLRAAAAMKDESSTVHFMVVGWGARREFVAERIRSSALHNVTLLPPCPAEQLNGYLNAADVGVISFRRGMAGVSVPSRLYNVMAAGRPVLAITDEESELAHVVSEEGVGWVLPPEDPEALVAFLRDLEHDREAVALAGRRSRSAAERRYSRGVVTDAWRRVLGELRPAPPTTLVHEKA